MCLVVDVLHSSKNQPVHEWTCSLLLIFGASWRYKCYIPRRTQTHPTNKQREVACEKKFEAPIPTPSSQKQGNRDVNELSHVNYVTKNASSSQHEAQLNIFEDSEPVIKMIVKDKSPTMRHVSRNHRVALDWLFGRVNLEPQIQIKYVDTKNQLADLLTKGTFTRDDWNHLLRLLNIMNVSMFSCSHFLSIDKPNTMSKRAQERRTGEELCVVVKSKPVSLVSRNLSAKQSPSLDSGASFSPGNGAEF